MSQVLFTEPTGSHPQDWQPWKEKGYKFVRVQRSIFSAAYIPAGYIEMSDFALIAVYSGHVRFALALSVQLVAGQRPEPGLRGPEMIAVARLTVSLLGVKSVSEVPWTMDIRSILITRKRRPRVRDCVERKNSISKDYMTLCMAYLVNIDRIAVLRCCRYIWDIRQSCGCSFRSRSGRRSSCSRTACTCWSARSFRSDRRSSRRCRYRIWGLKERTMFTLELTRPRAYSE